MHKVYNQDTGKALSAPIWIGNEWSGSYYWLKKYLGFHRWEAENYDGVSYTIERLSPNKAVELAFSAGETATSFNRR